MYIMFLDVTHQHSDKKWVPQSRSPKIFFAGLPPRTLPKSKWQLLGRQPTLDRSFSPISPCVRGMCPLENILARSSCRGPARTAQRERHEHHDREHFSWIPSRPGERSKHDPPVTNTGYGLIVLGCKWLMIPR